MRPAFGALILALCSSLVASLPSPGYRVKESVAPPRGWTKGDEPAADHLIVLRIGLPQPNFNVLEQHLFEVSDPDHTRYGQYLSKEKVEELVAPHPSSLEAVNKWLASYGLEEADLARSPAQDWITIKVPVKTVEKMLDTVSIIPNCVFNHLLTPSARNTTSGSTLPPETSSSERPATACPLSSTTTSMLSNPRPCLADSRLPSPLLFGMMMKNFPLQQRRLEPSPTPRVAQW